MKKFTVLLGIVMLSATGVQAQTAVDSVKSAINKLFLAMKNSDGAALKACFADSATLQTVARDRTGAVVVKKEIIAEFASLISTMPKNTADELITYEVVKVDGSLAIAWTPYKFYLSGQFSHCGVNSFQLVRINGYWKIISLIDTRRKQPCA